MKRKGIRSVLERISPRRARQWLDSRAANRPIADGWVRMLAEAMKAGEWRVNGESIKFNDKGELEDGQHRLEAILLSGAAIESYVTYGLSGEIFDSIDQGRKRTVADLFGRSGELNCTILAGAITWLWKQERGFLDVRHQATPRRTESLAVLAQHPALRESVQCGRKARGIMSPSAAAFLHYRFCEKDRKLAGQFFDLLVSGENLTKSKPETCGIYRLRERLKDNKSSKAKLPGIEIIALAIKAWSYVRAGQVIKNLRWRSDGDSRKTFPVIV